MRYFLKSTSIVVKIYLVKAQKEIHKPFTSLFSFKTTQVEVFLVAILQRNTRGRAILTVWNPFQIQSDFTKSQRAGWNHLRTISQNKVRSIMQCNLLSFIANILFFTEFVQTSYMLRIILRLKGTNTNHKILRVFKVLENCTCFVMWQLSCWKWASLLQLSIR